METQKNIYKIRTRVKILVILFILSFNFISLSSNTIEQINNIDFNNITNSLEKVYNVYYNNMGEIFEYQNNIITNILFKKGLWITATNNYSFSKNELALLYGLEGNTLFSYKLYNDLYIENTNRIDFIDSAFFEMLTLPTSKWDKVIINKYISSPHNTYQYSLNKAEYYSRIGKYDKAINEVKKAKIKYGNKIGFNLTKFISLYLQEKYNEAAIEAETLCNKGVINKKLAKAFIITAINTTNKYLGINGFEILFKVNNGNLTNETVCTPYLSYLIKNKLYNKALKTSEDILKIDPKNIYARQIALTVLVKQNNYKKFKELCLSLLEHSSEPRIGEIMGAIGQKNKDYSFSRKGYEIAINKGNNKPKIYKNYGIVLEKLGDYKAASNAFIKSEKLKINKTSK